MLTLGSFLQEEDCLSGKAHQELSASPERVQSSGSIEADKQIMCPNISFPGTAQGCSEVGQFGCF